MKFTKKEIETIARCREIAARDGTVISDKDAELIIQEERAIFNSICEYDEPEEIAKKLRRALKRNEIKDCEYNPIHITSEDSDHELERYNFSILTRDFEAGYNMKFQRYLSISYWMACESTMLEVNPELLEQVLTQCRNLTGRNLSAVQNAARQEMRGA
ncbi:MAG: hypothetical protein LBB23_02840 [Rickettsiales bacterium]|jgi:hypothetical protein|nr:hypothetical protein [Rickettsiales bacterium]